VIKSIKSKVLVAVLERRRVAALGEDVQRAAYRRMVALQIADDLNELRVPPGNRLEKLSGDRAGQHSLRVNDQWRLCFVWKEDGAHDVELVDYH
jgi:proteic killer suppression protein